MGIQTTYDTVIIGAGPAGATAAYLLAKAGLDVLVLEKNRFPRSKLCGGLITWKTVGIINEIFGCGVDGLSAQGIIVHKSGTYAICDNRHQAVEGRLAYPFHFVDRAGYDNLWLESARNAGAKLLCPATVRTVDVESQTVITTEGDRYGGKYILGTDGALSRVKKALVGGGYLKEKTRAGLARAIEVKLPSRYAAGLPNYPRIYYGCISGGYAWSFPGPGYQLLGIAGLSEKKAGNILAAFNRFLASLSISLPDEVKLSAAPLPYGNFFKAPGWGNILMAGDAGGFVDPLLGEGIYHAHRSAQLAAESIISCSGNSHNSDALAIYCAALARRMIPDLRYARAGRNLVYALPQRWYYPVLTTFLKIIRKACEDTIQGRRTYLWFRKIK